MRRRRILLSKELSVQELIGLLERIHDGLPRGFVTLYFAYAIYMMCGGIWLRWKRSFAAASEKFGIAMICYGTCLLVTLVFRLDGWQFWLTLMLIAFVFRTRWKNIAQELSAGLPPAPPPPSAANPAE